MKKVLYFVCVLGILTAGVVTVLKFGLKPGGKGVMKPSFFEQPEEIGAVTFRRFYAPIEERKMVFFGVAPQPDWHPKIVEGFLKAAAAEKQPFEVLVTDDTVPELNLAGLPPMEKLVVRLNTSDQTEVTNVLKHLVNAKKKTLIYTVSVFSSHILDGNPINRLEKTAGMRFFSISTGPLALRPNQEHLVDPPCLGSERDVSGQAALGCTILRSGRKYYRKQVPQEKFVAIISEQGIADYLVLVSAPGQTGSAVSASGQ